MNSIYWIIILAVLIFIEILTLKITTIWFAGGALTAFIVSLYLDNLILEIILFLAVSISLLYFTRPLVMEHFHPRTNNSLKEGVVGREAIVTSTIDNMNTSGQVDVDGQEWSAWSLEGIVLEKGTKVIVQGMSGKKLIVRKYQAD
jgi:Membrane protein implicated in regulation of membrane protease activity